MTALVLQLSIQLKVAGALCRASMLMGDDNSGITCESGVSSANASALDQGCPVCCANRKD